MELLDILALTVENLQGKLAELGLETDGTKTILQARLIEYYQNFSNKADAEYGEAPSVIRQTDAIEQPGSTFSLRDIEDSISKFSGEGQPGIDQWLQDFEDCEME